MEERRAVALCRVGSEVGGGSFVAIISALQVYRVGRMN